MCYEFYSHLQAFKAAIEVLDQIYCISSRATTAAIIQVYFKAILNWDSLNANATNIYLEFVEAKNLYVWKALYILNILCHMKSEQFKLFNS